VAGGGAAPEFFGVFVEISLQKAYGCWLLSEVVCMDLNQSICIIEA
jgi:hypothetical protein